jgi:hypothetical protein
MKTSYGWKLLPYLRPYRLRFFWALDFPFCRHKPDLPPAYDVLSAAVAARRATLFRPQVPPAPEGFPSSNCKLARSLTPMGSCQAGESKSWRRHRTKPFRRSTAPPIRRGRRPFLPPYRRGVDADRAVNGGAAGAPVTCTENLQRVPPKTRPGAKIDAALTHALVAPARLFACDDRSPVE